MMGSFGSILRDLFRVAGTLALGAAAVFGMPAARASGGGVMLTVTARVASYLRVHPGWQAGEVRVTREDLERGFVEVSSASGFVVETNAAEGYAVEFAASGTWFREVLVSGPREPLRLAGTGARIVLAAPPARRAVHDLSYRFMLGPEARPGAYAWPVSLSVRPR